MIIHNASFLVGPLLLAAWCIDLYLLLTACRLIASRLSGTAPAQLCQGLQPVTDTIPLRIHRWMSARTAGHSTPAWLPWAITIGGGLLLRHLLIWVVIWTA